MVRVCPAQAEEKPKHEVRLYNLETPTTNLQQWQADRLSY